MIIAFCGHLSKEQVERLALLYLSEAVGRGGFILLKVSKN